MKPFTLVIVGALAATGIAGTPARPAKKAQHPVPQSRVDTIMAFANDRMSTQIDVMFEDGDFPAVISLLRVQAEAYPSDYDVWTNLGWMQENVQAYDTALATYARYRRQNAADPDAALPEATFYFNRRLYAKVPPLMEPTIKGKCHPNAFRILARAYEKQDMLSDAARVYKALSLRDPNDGAAKVNLKRVEGKLSQGK
jgi:tetratricopeptide (TPR) repeat protein